MRKIIAILALIIGLSTVCLGLLHQGNVLRAMYERDTALAYNAGVKHGIEQAVDSSPDVEALTVLFSRYPAIKAPVFIARCVVLSSARYRVPQVILAGMVLQESSGKSDARSSCGAVGLTQIRWKFWGQALKDAGICEKESDLLDPETSIEAGAFIVRQLLDRYGDIDKALKHYSGSAKRYIEKVIRRVVG